MESFNTEYVQAIVDGYAESETLASTEIPSASFPAILESIQQNKQRVQSEVRRVSQEIAPDVDGWIQQAKHLQADIERSKTTAREIVQAAEAAASQRRENEELLKKSRLLEGEVVFTHKLESALKNARVAVEKLAVGQDAAAHARPEIALEQLETVQRILAELRPVENTTVVELLVQKVEKLRATLVEDVKRRWDSTIEVDRSTSKVTFRTPQQTVSQAPNSSLIDIVDLSSRLNLLPDNIARTCHHITSVILKPRLDVGIDGRVAQLSFQEHEISISGRMPPPSCISLLDDMATIVKTLNSNLPPSITVELSESLMPPLIAHLISYWLMPSVPTSLEAVNQFHELLQHVEQLAAILQSIGWSGSAQLLEWTEQGPKNWLSSRREESLSAVRAALAGRLNSTSTVERSETQAVSHEDVIVAQQSSGDDWNSDWTNTAAPVSPTTPAHRSTEDDDFNAWDAADKPNPSRAAPPEREPSVTNGEEAEESDAWGWNDQDANSVPNSPIAARNVAANADGTSSNVKIAGTHLTLKETYTVTAIPDELRDIVVQISRDAESLRSAQYEDSPIAPAAAALYTQPTLVLAGFRALAPTFYASVPGGNMLLYNDSMRLASELEKFQISQIARDTSSDLSQSAWPSSRMRLDVDISALEAFGRRAYGREMESQRVILRDLLDGAQGFTNCTEMPFTTECENSVTSVIDRIRDVGKQWAPILSHSALLQSLGSLLMAVTSKMIVDIEDLSDISEAESHRLRHFCNEISTLSELFVQENVSVFEQTAKDMTALYTSNWIKFQYLSEILESSLVEIKRFWSETDLRLEFESGELIDLIEALFADTDHRRRAIAEIRGS